MESLGQKFRGLFQQNATANRSRSLSMPEAPAIDSNLNEAESSALGSLVRESARPNSFTHGRNQVTASTSRRDSQQYGDSASEYARSPLGIDVPSDGPIVKPAVLNTENPFAADFKFASKEPILIRLVPYNPYFPTVEKELSSGDLVPIGRHQRNGNPGDSGNEGIYYRSTVVSRRHAQLMFIDGEFYIKDTKSLGGTFINSTRLAVSGKESKPAKINHGDVLQFGVDYRPDARTGQVRNKDKCVELRVEFPSVVKKPRGPRPPKWKPGETDFSECCICISSLYQKQALFIAPCNHAFHYRCIAPLLRSNGFQCPMCRQESNLYESLYSLCSEDEEEENDDVDSHNSINNPSTPNNRATMNGDNPASSVISQDASVTAEL